MILSHESRTELNRTLMTELGSVNNPQVTSCYVVFFARDQAAVECERISAITTVLCVTVPNQVAACVSAAGLRGRVQRRGGVEVEHHRRLLAEHQRGRRHSPRVRHAQG